MGAIIIPFLEMKQLRPEVLGKLLSCTGSGGSRIFTQASSPGLALSTMHCMDPPHWQPLPSPVGSGFPRPFQKGMCALPNMRHE